jgi:hypothetical protein
MPFFILEPGEFKPPVRAAIAPKMKVQGVEVASKRTQVVNEEAHWLGGDKELERAIMQTRNIGLSGRATNGGLKDEANGDRRIFC